MTDPTEDRLRHALETAAAQVETSPDALATIRHRIDRRRWWQLRWPALAALGAGAVVVAAALAGLSMCQPVHTTSPQPQPAAPAAPKGTLLPVYYLGPDQRLYREFHPGSNASTAERTRAALTLMLDPHSPYDPDYTSDWPVAAAVRDVRLSDDTVTVDLTGVTTAPDRAVQQLVWTATAASGATAVRLLSDGVPVTSFGGIADKAGLLHRDRAVDVLGLVWLIDPQQGATVGRTVRVQLYGSVFEATVHLRVRQGGSTVTEQAVTLSAGQPAFGEAITSVTLAPGRYTIEAYAVSAKDGSPQYLDDHDITVS